MPETTFCYNPETGKPNPVSVREFHLMDRKEARAYMRPLSKREQKDFYLATVMAWESLPLQTRREIQQAYVDKLGKRDNKSIGDKIELFREKLYLKHLMLPEKKPIFFRKLRTKEHTFPKWMKETKSPYLISSQLKTI